MEKAIRERLEAPFDAKHVSKRKGQRGETLSYIEGSQYIARMNAASEGEWSYSVLQSSITPRTTPPRGGGAPLSDIVVLVEVTAFGQRRQAYGGAVTPAAECLGDDMKAALTDALKKALSTWGVALDLYTKGELETQPTDNEPPRSHPITAAQEASINEAAEKLGWSAGKLRAAITKRYNRPLARLDEAQAAEVLQGLLAALSEQK